MVSTFTTQFINYHFNVESFEQQRHQFQILRADSGFGDETSKQQVVSQVSHHLESYNELQHIYSKSWQPNSDCVCRLKFFGENKPATGNSSANLWSIFAGMKNGQSQHSLGLNLV